MSVRGDRYHLMALSDGRLTEVVAGAGRSSRARDRVRLSTGDGRGGHEVEVSTGAPSRRFDVHHLRHEGGAEWRSVRLRDVRITAVAFCACNAPVSIRRGGDLRDDGVVRDVNVELRRYDGERLARRAVAAQKIPTGRAVQLAPSDWTRLARGKIHTSVS